MSPRRLEELEGADDVGLHEGAGPVDRAIDVGFGREIHDRAGSVLGEQLGDEGAIADVAVDEHVPGIRRDAGEVVEVARVRELVEVHNARPGGDFGEHEVRPDEAGAAGDEEGIHERTRRG